MGRYVGYLDRLVVLESMEVDNLSM